MDDQNIVDLFWQRSETAIYETAEKYGSYCYQIAYNLLQNKSDAEECVNDAYWKLWDNIPPERPNRLSAYLGRITRNIALNRYEASRAKKRWNAGGMLSTDLFQPYCADSKSTNPHEIAELRDIVNRFLRLLPEQAMIIFLRRYWYFDSISDISQYLGVTQTSVKVTLHRVRRKFAEYLQSEGYCYE